MKRKLFLGMSALVLGITGVLAGRASAKFASATSLYYKTAGGCVATRIAGLSGNTKLVTNIASTHPVQFVTAGGAATYTIYATSTCNAQVYFQP